VQPELRRLPKGALISRLADEGDDARAKLARDLLEAPGCTGEICATQVSAPPSGAISRVREAVAELEQRMLLGRNQQPGRQA
jgi:hypothetical protein